MVGFKVPNAYSVINKTQQITSETDAIVTALKLAAFTGRNSNRWRLHRIKNNFQNPVRVFSHGNNKQHCNF
jgi:hypothetical protein